MKKDIYQKRAQDPEFLRTAVAKQTAAETSPTFWFPPTESFNSTSNLPMTMRVLVLATTIPPFPYFYPFTYGPHEKIQYSIS